MTHWAKFRRAYEHLHAIDAVIERFLDMKPYRFIGEYEPRPPFAKQALVRYTLRLHAPVPLPPELPALIGDCLTNLRASLDHLIYGIALKHTGRDDLADQTRLQFAIYDDAGKFGSWAGIMRKNSLLPDAVITLIEQFQPYYDYKGPQNLFERHLTRNPLWILNALVNADKHRTLMPVTQLRIGSIRFRNKIPGEETEASVTIGGSFQHGATIFPYNFIPDSPTAEVTVEPDFAADVAFSDDWPARSRPVSQLIHALADRIREKVFPEFEAFL
jgi:hypothetical protein